MRKLRCPKCGAAIPTAILKSDLPYNCHICRKLQHTEVFPAFFDEAEKGKTPEKALLDEDARCFIHPDKIAVVPCAECGIFLCDLCDIHVDGTHLCSKCFKNNKDGMKSFRNKTVLYDEIVFALAFAPFLFPIITIITAPAVLVCAFLFRKKLNNTPYIRSHWRYYTAIVVAILQIMTWIGILVMALDK